MARRVAAKKASGRAQAVAVGGRGPETRTGGGAAEPGWPRHGAAESIATTTAAEAEIAAQRAGLSM
ncbi:hypothetical protein BU197_07575 [Streptomyces sp. CBMA291]|nr:hypothetical protein [Streptomyces sp. CBMA291]MBD0716501.1 hypothetical protein [Streptomyces sp. CBMA370]